MFGTLGKSVPAANTLTTVYRIAANCKYGKISILAINPNVAIATINIAISTTTTPAPEEYIAKAYPLDAVTGFLQINEVLASPSEYIIVSSDKADTIFRAFGEEVVE